MESDVDYFCRRVAEETAAASKADHPTARQAHLNMAERYRDLADAIRDRETVTVDEIPAIGS